MAASLLDIRYKIDGLNFSIASPEQILESSVLEVTEPNLYSKGIPNANACNDLRLGTVDRRFRCGTCRHSGLEVHGPPRAHPPRLPRLPLALLRESAQVVAVRVLLVLQPPRGPQPSGEPAPLPDLQEANEAPGRRVVALQAPKLLQVRRAAAELREGGPVDHGRLDRRGTQRAGEGEGRRPVPTPRWRGRSSSSSRTTTAGSWASTRTTTRPENMVLTVMLVPSVIIRPTTSIQESSRTKGHDDLTTLLRDIVKYSNLVREKLAESRRVPHPGLRATRRARLHVLRQGRRGDHRNDVSWRHGRGEDHAKAHHPFWAPQVPRETPWGKQGRFRHTIVGKRSNFTSRGVVGPSPNDEIWQLRVPLIVAKTQTVPSRVTPFNVQKMRALVMRGDHPDGEGCHHVERPDGSSINMRMCQDRELVARALRKGGSSTAT